MTRPSALPPRNRHDRASRIRHLGFKDIAVTEASVGVLVNRIKARSGHVLCGSGQRHTASCGLVDSDGSQDRRRSGPGRSGDGDGHAGPARNRYRILSVRRAPCGPSDESRRLTRLPRMPSRSRCRLFGCRSARLPALTGTDPGARGAGRTPSPSGRAPRPSCFWLRMYDNTASRCVSRLLNCKSSRSSVETRV